MLYILGALIGYYIEQWTGLLIAYLIVGIIHLTHIKYAKTSTKKI